MRNTLLLVIGFTVLGTLFQVQAGPPLICHPYSIGDAKSLSWGGGSDWDAHDKAYDTASLSNDTLAILDQATPVLVRMETMRRAVIYGARDQKAALALLEQLKMRAAADEKSAKPNGFAYFDYGYFLASLKQVDWLYKQDLSAGIDGYEFVKRALALNPESPEMHFAAAIIASFPPRPSEREEHLRKARADKNDHLLARNLNTHFQ
jgi:hypothetical protein